jgi:hypothetical protein
MHTLERRKCTLNWTQVNFTQLGYMQPTISYNHTIFTSMNAKIDRPIWGYKRQMDRSESDICFYFTVKILLYHTINLLKVTHLTITTFKPTKSTNILKKRLQYPTLTNNLEVNDGQLKKRQNQNHMLKWDLRDKWQNTLGWNIKEQQACSKT